MEIGLFSVSERYNKVAAKTYEEDLSEIVLADRLGMQEAWVAEHVGHSDFSRSDQMSVPDLFICKAAAMTKQIRLGPGVRQLPFYHPVQSAIEAAVCDHLTLGRYNAGFGGGSNTPNGSNQLEQRGMGTESDRRGMMYEAIELILKAWTAEEPFDWDGEYFHGRRIRVEPKPYQKPHMPIGMACTGTDSTLRLVGQRGFLPLFAFNDSAEHVRDMGNEIGEAAQEAGLEFSRNAIRVCRYVHVAGSKKRARDEVRPGIEPSIDRRKQRFPEQFASVLPPSGDVSEINFDYLADRGVYIVGDPDSVYQDVKDFYDESHGFGVMLIVAGKDIATHQQRARSMRMFMREVAPRLRELDPDGRPLSIGFAG